MLVRLHQRLHDAIARRPWAVIAAAGALLALAVPVLIGSARLDMSFRPLFANDTDAAAATAEFESRFGQESGAHVGVLLENAAAAGALQQRLRAIPHISGVADPVQSNDGLVTLLLARLDLPLDALAERRVVIDSIQSVIDAWLPDGARARLTGVSVVEAAYADAIPRGLAISLVLTTAAIIALLFLLFRSAAAVVTCMAGVALAVPLTMALFALAGKPVTLLSSMAPTVILIIGVADAIHMVRRWQALRGERRGISGATRAMMAQMALPCLLTTVTTCLGFAALGTARINGIRDFGVCAAVGVLAVYACNMLLVPALLHVLGRRMTRPPRQLSLSGVTSLVVARPRAVIAASALVSVVMLLGILRVRVDQRLNEELSPEHPVRQAQALLEREFGGFLGPDVEIARRDGGSIDDVARERAAALAARLRELDEVDGVTTAERAHHLALHVQTGDLGSRHALRLAGNIRAIAAAELGTAHRATVVGQWWLAQLGTASLLRDMLASFLTSALLVLPVLALALRSRRLFLIALPANLLPMAAALAFMGWSGITLRLGTALVLAVALAIAVDDTIHLLVSAHAARSRGSSARNAVRHALRESGPALVATTLVLVAGFLSMLVSPIAAIRHMGLVAAVALGTALLADLLLLPALYVLLERTRIRLRHPAFAATSSVGSRRVPHEANLCESTRPSAAAHAREVAS